MCIRETDTSEREITLPSENYSPISWTFNPMRATDQGTNLLPVGENSFHKQKCEKIQTFFSVKSPSQ